MHAAPCYVLVNFLHLLGQLSSTVYSFANLQLNICVLRYQDASYTKNYKIKLFLCYDLNN